MRDENDLHRLVDGLLDAGRMGEVLLHLKTNAPEAARVAGWREQNELLRAAFAGVEEEAVPASLRLTLLRLRCVSDDAPIAEPTMLPLTSLAVPSLGASRGLQDRPDGPSRRRRHTCAAAVSLIALVASMLAVSWLATNHPSGEPRPVPFAATADAGGLATPVIDEAEAIPEGVPDLPTTMIPDLGALGFEFIGAAPQTPPARTIIFSYRKGPTVRLTVSVSRRGADFGRTEQTGTIGWQRDGRSFMLGGTLDHDGLAAVAAYIQTTDVSP